MAKPTFTTLILCVAVLFGAAACGPSLVIQDVDYSQPIESVLSPDSDNEVHDQRFSVKFNLNPILAEEGVSSVEEIRLIRNRSGFYFVTASGFTHVYVFKPEEDELALEHKIEITEEGLQEPAFNQRGSHIELVDLTTGQTYNLDQTGRR